VAGEPINVWDYERLAEERLSDDARAYYFGGAGDEWTLRENVAAFNRWTLRPRYLVDVGTVSTETTVLGEDVSMPVLVAPTAMQRFAHDEAECATARATTAAGTIQCLSSVSTVKPRLVADAAPDGKRWFQVYVFTDRGVTRELIQEAVDAGYSALVVTVDVPFLGRRESDMRVAFEIPAEFEVPDLGNIDPSLTWRDLEWIAGYGLPVVVKGLMTHEDAALACEHGAAAVVVSNHGGRQLDGVAASIDALPEVAGAVSGGCEVYLDGGVRRGIDVLKALALGARAALVGRPILWGLAVDGERGVAHVLELLREEVRFGLGLLGCSSPADVNRSHVQSVLRAASP
jgi:isopentenyl diphosphate isomerase/L-lactate dehydrogenase-like FMN-dependent dehydrogenase